MSFEPSFALSCPTPLADREHILLAHGSGGRLSSQLIERVVLPLLRNPTLERLEDCAQLAGPRGSRLAFTTDSYVVSPIFFPGGDIGELAVNGTINDLAVGGARPLALSLALVLEEGLSLAVLRRVLESVSRAARRAGVSIVTGDTKVVGRGKGDQIFITTSGIGIVPDGVDLGSHRVGPGDAVLLSGTIADHGIAVMSVREDLGLDGAVASDTAPLADLARSILEVCPETRAMRDPTRGGVAATLVEIATRQGLGIDLVETAIPVSEPVRGACELLGLDPLIVANEGKLIAFVPEAAAERALAAMRGHTCGREATRIGTVTASDPGLVSVRTAIGGRRILDLPFSEPLPRIC